MLRRILFLGYYFLLWVGLFGAARAVFLFAHYNKATGVSLSDNGAAFWYGLRMDFSMASYLLLPVCLFVLCSVFIPMFRKIIIYKIYSAILLLFFLLITIADVEVYKQWGFRIDATPLKYLSSPAEAWASISHLPLLLYSLLFIFLYAGLLFLFNAFLNRKQLLLENHSKGWLSAISLVCFIPFLIIPLRGGFQQSPLNQSNVYFSNEPFANHLAINASWNFLHGVLNESAETKNPYNYLPPEEAVGIVDSLFSNNGTTQFFLKTNDPNVVLIIWESFTAKALSYTLDGKAVAPNFNKLKGEGVYFSNMWASGDRTDKGLAAILSGYPALPTSSIIRTPNKAARLPSITKIFRDRGYSTPFYYGGEAAFANIKSYLTNAGVASIIEKKDFATKDQNSKWGAHDGVVADKFTRDIAAFRQPFFATWLTLSSHEPFEIPKPSPFKGRDDVSRFLASINYTDEVIGNFIRGCEKQPWWNNTLVIIIADHGHIYPPSSKEQNFIIPMLWLGGALKKKGIEVNKICSQQDLAATLVKQVGHSEKPFPFSKNILDTTAKPWAFFSFNNGFGLVQPNSIVIFDNVGKKEMSSTKASISELRKGQALQQIFFQDYLNK